MRPPVLPRRPAPGPALAAITAVVSGVSVFANSYGVHAIASPSVYTTAKNIVAEMVIAAIALAGHRSTRRSDPAPAATGSVTRDPLRAVGLAYVAVVGGGLAFVLFFNGLAATTATPAAFWRDTLLVWVALLAVPLLGERLAWWNAAAIGLLIAGQITVAGGFGHLAADRGEMLVLVSSILWAIEVIVAKVLLRQLAPITVSSVRMGGGAITLVVYLAATGHLDALLSLGARQVGWALVTGLLLAAYVVSWMAALDRARAVDVTSILVGGALVTWLLQAAAGTAPTGARPLGLILVAAGIAVLVGAAVRRPVPRRARRAVP